MGSVLESMSKYGNGGTDVYINRLYDGTKFRVINGAWNGEIKYIDGLPRIIVNEDFIEVLNEDSILAITTESEIPREAYVYDSAYYAFLIETLIEELHFNKNRLKYELLTSTNRGEIMKDIKDITIRLNSINYIIDLTGDESFE